jgi:hypothetical protein
MTQRAVLAIAMSCIVACGKSRIESSSPSRSMAAQVYAALIDSLYKQPDSDTLLIADSTMSFRVPTNALAKWRQQFDSIPSDLPHRLEVASQIWQPSNSLPLPRPIRVLSYAELGGIFKSGPGNGWAEFSRRYPRQGKYLRLTPIAFSADSVDALTYYEYHCGPLCGGGNAVWLERDVAHRWKIRKVVRFWIS